MLARAEELSQPYGPRALWLALLEDEFGRQLLRDLDLQFSELKALAEPLDEGREQMADCLTLARRLTMLTDPGFDCVEQVVHGLLIDRESEFAKMLDSLNVDRSLTADRLHKLMREGAKLSTYNENKVGGGTEGEYVRACLEKETLASQVLREAGIDLELVMWAADEWKAPLTPMPRLGLGRVTPGHLALGLAHCKSVKQVMSTAGIIPLRLRQSIARRVPKYPHHALRRRERMDVLAPGCEEAQRLGHKVVTPNLLLLGLLGDPQSSASRALSEAGFCLRTLRSELSQPGVGLRGESTFDGDSKRAMGKAAELGGETPEPVHLLAALIPLCDCLKGQSKRLKEAVIKIREGSLDRQQPILLDGLSPGLTVAQVAAVLGEGRKKRLDSGETCWEYDGSAVIFCQGRVVGISGREVTQGGQSILRAGDPSLEADVLLGVKQRVELPGPPATDLEVFVGVDATIKMILWSDSNWLADKTAEEERA